MVKHHYLSFEINDSFSGIIYQNFITRLDPDGLYFTAKDTALLSINRFKIDDAIRNRSCFFVNSFAEKYQGALKQAKSLLGEISTEPLDFTIGGSIEFVVEGMPKFARDKLGLKEVWRKWLKYRVLEEFFKQSKRDVEYGIDKLTLRAPQILSLVAEREIMKIDQMLNYDGGLEGFVFHELLQVVAGHLDPHTTFFTPGAKMGFEESLSHTNSTFGFEIIQNGKNEIQIAKLIPGSPAWKSGELNKGDVLIFLKVPNGKFVDMTNIGLDEADNLLGDPEIESVELTVLKPGGMEKTVFLKKAKLQADDKRIISFILQGKRKIAYIELPAFYGGFENANQLGSANDFARELVKLKKDGIEGLIFDLRFNGGGSLKEAVDLAGIFINAGPLAIMDRKGEKPVTLKDPNMGAIYNGPLVVLVNGLSASASELFAAAMQDYNRAVIVGGKTFGKGTGQQLMPVDPKYNAKSTSTYGLDLSLGYISITSFRNFRVTGGAYQLNGVTPDIALPDIFNALDVAEASYHHALPSKRIDKKTYYSPLPALPVAKLSEASDIRTGNDQQFLQIKENIQSLQKLGQNEKYFLPLAFSDFNNHKKGQEELFNRLEKLNRRPSPTYNVFNTLWDLPTVDIDPYQKELNERSKQRIGNDIYVGEAYEVINDLIEIENK